MAKQQVLIRIDKDLNERWGKVAKKLKISKSGIVQDFLEQVIPILEKEEPKDILGTAFKQLGDVMHDTGSLFD
jgi:antitoxin component of RelBE/YafQ-DinJ toxin-antitoxin module